MLWLLRKQAQEKIKSDRARARFEFQKARKEQEEMARTAKREARKQAAEQAKAMTAGRSDKPQESEDIVKTAMARAAELRADRRGAEGGARLGLRQVRGDVAAVTR